MANEAYDVFDIGYNRILIKEDDWYEENTIASKTEDAVSPTLISSGALVGNTTVEDGYLQSANYVAGVTGWKLTPTTAYLPAIDLSGYLLATGGAYKTAATGSRVEIFPDATTGFIAYDDAGDAVFTILVGGTDQGDVIFGGASNYAKWDKSAGTFTLNGAAVTSCVLTGMGSGSDFSVLNWQNTVIFSATDYNTVAWAAGTITLSDGTTFNIDAGNTGNIAALTYIYFDKAVSETALQTTTTASTANGANKILIAVCSPNTDTSSDATFQVFGGSGGQLITVDNIAANSASTNEFISNSAQIKDAIITSAKIESITASQITSGTITSRTITLTFTPGGGDCYIAAGKSSFSLTEGGSGFIMGIDDSDDTVKFIIGNNTEYLAVVGDTFVNKLKVMPYTASVGGVSLLSTTTERQTSSTTYVKLKELTVGRRGDYKLTWELNTYMSAPQHGYGSLRKNGVEVQSTSALGGFDSENTYTFSSLVPGDIITGWGKVESGSDGPVGIKEFDLKVDETDEVYPPAYTSGYS